MSNSKKNEKLKVIIQSGEQFTKRDIVELVKLPIYLQKDEEST